MYVWVDQMYGLIRSSHSKLSKIQFLSVVSCSFVLMKYLSMGDVV